MILKQAGLIVFGLLFLFNAKFAMAGEESLRVAVASSLQPVIGNLAVEFEQQTGQPVSVILDSSAVIENQIRQGAPYDLAIFADTVYSERLKQEKRNGDGVVEREIFLHSGVLVYATRDAIMAIEQQSRIAIANPELAPYGRAARSWIDQNIETDSQPEIISAPNARAAYDFLQRGEVDGAFIPRSFLTDADSQEFSVSRNLTSLPTVAVLIGPSNELSRAFAAFLESPERAGLWKSQGYGSSSVAEIIDQNDSRSSGLISTILISFQVSFLATILAMIIGTGFAWLLYRQTRWSMAFLENLVLLPLVLPPTVLGFYLLVLIGQNGPIGEAWIQLTGSPLAFTRTAAVIAATIGAVPFVTRIMISAFRSIPEETLEYARIDGASGWPFLTHVLLPLVRPAVLSAMSLAWAKSLGDFGATIMVAGSIPGKTRTASLGVYDAMLSGNQDQAIRLSLILVGMSLSLLILTWWFDRETDH